MEFNENSIQDLIKEKLETRGVGIVKTRLNLSNTNFDIIWKRKFNEKLPVLQPEIDIVVKDEFSINAIEVKYFKEENKKFNYPYYKGIDQAIAYLRFGFDHVALWHIFDKIPLEQFKDYGWRTWDFLRELNLPLGFTYYLFDKNDNSLKAKQNNDPNDDKLLPDLSKLSKHIAWRLPNPYLLTIEGKKIRSVINEIDVLKSD